MADERVTLPRRALSRLRRYAHRTRVACNFLVHYLQLRARRTFGRVRKRPFVAISLCEHLGDIVASEPLARHLRERFPDAYLVWLVRKPYYEIVSHNPHVDGVLTVTCLTECRYFRESGLFEHFFEAHFWDRRCPTCLAPLRKKEGDLEISTANYYQHGSLLPLFCRSAGLPALEEQPKLYIPAAASARVDALGLNLPFVAIHRSSNEIARDWSAEKWRELLERLLGAWKISVVEVGGALRNGPGPASMGTDLTGRLSILETAEVIRRAVLFVGVDSGPAHLANAAGTPGILILGHYLAFKRYQPYTGAYTDRSHADLLFADGPAAMLPVADVYQAAARRLEALGIPKRAQA